MTFDKVAVHTYYDGSKNPQWASFGLKSAQLQKVWADKHGYSFKAHVGRQLPRMVHAWDKIPILIGSIKNTDADWHMVFDADIFITNLKLDLNTLLKDYDHRKVFTGKDWLYPINAGVLLVHRTALKLLNAVLKLKGACPDNLYEQGVIQMFREACAEWHHEICPVDHRIFNSYSANLDEGFKGTWENGDFLVHFAGWPLERILSVHGDVFNRSDSIQPEALSDLLCKSLQSIREKVLLTKKHRV